MNSLLLLSLLQAASGLNVAVAGATGRTGQLVVTELLAAGHQVVALTRDVSKAKDVLPDTIDCRLIDLATCTSEDMKAACSDADRMLWCATGFTDSGESIDIRGMNELIPAAFPTDSQTAASPPTVVMLSSAGVTRPAWTDEKKERLIGASDIPIIRLNPGGILGKKAEAEQHLRESGVSYCVVRPTGLKFEGWPRGRPIFSQGDVAVGRTNVEDLASVLVDVLSEGGASGKTFEMFTLAGYPPARDGIGSALAKLALDGEGGAISEAEVTATYGVLQQMLPGEEQDATKLEMGRTYEQVDAGAVAARERGAAPTDRELQLASNAMAVGAGGGGGKRQAVRDFLGQLLKR
jgi:uncharacterized protein YbjT (DUF2867 family)